ncbi:MBL fold metallo-hydrolase [Clostridium sp. AF18-27]|uniref:MBL fold metallo-hydrolase n=1 Tax=Enterocloster lavalensis TaxID=460384 RepID=UPI000E47487C|nr:MBL fold metallo-hydrolase [Enterocloster lavalensis]RHR49320.1 MBL fold metallo-hydrolase [Clostridium sp. AF18-27]
MQNNRIAVTSLGGSGEEARNCFLLEAGNHTVLLDCGVRREALGEFDRVYPALTREIAGRLTAVFLSHAHEDHVAALPYLYELGYRGNVYGTEETIRLARGFMKKWADFVTSAGGRLPFSVETMNRVAFSTISLGSQVVEGLSVTAGRSGHMLGSCWLRFEHGGKSLLYTGDMTLAGRLLATDLPPESDGAVVDCAYAGRTLSQAGQYDALVDLTEEVAAGGGKLLLPVPPNGRGSDILLHLCENLRGVPVYAEANVAALCGELLKERKWLRADVCGRISGAGEESNGAGLPCGRIDAVALPGRQIDAVALPCGQIDAVGLPCGRIDAVALPCGQIDAVGLPCGRIDAMNRANTFTNAISLPDVQSRSLALSAPGPAVYLTGDGMMSGPVAAAYFEALKGDARNCILITGHTARSALGSRIFEPAFRAQAGLAARAERLTIKVHLDDQDVIALNRSVRAKKILLFHAPLENTRELTGKLRNLGVDARCGLEPRALEL